MQRRSALLAAAALLCLATSAQTAAVGAWPARALRTASTPLSTAREAYVTFVVSEEYVLGARVLGQSLRESGTKRCVQSLALLMMPRASRPAAAPAPRLSLRHAPLDVP
jgi:Arc/MetJ family transcription regulator